MIRIGLSSTALLTASARNVIAAASAAGIDAIEWAGDIHVPHNDASVARETMIDTLRAGLTTASYAPLYRVESGGEPGLRFDAVLDAAVELHSPILRVFVGESSATSKDAEQRGHLIAELKRLGDRAGQRGMTVCLSFGRNTYLDRYAPAVDLVNEIAHPFVRLAWEALPGTAPEECSAALEAAGGSVGMLLVRRIERDGASGPLEKEEAAWRKRLAAFKRAEIDPKMGQFIVIGAIRDSAPQDSAAALPGLAEDVALLRRLIAEIE